MVNKPNLSNEIMWHTRNQDEIVKLWSDQFAASNNGTAFDMKMSSALALIACAQNWELFLSRWHIRAIARDSGALANHLSGTVSKFQFEGMLSRLHDAGHLPLALHLPKHLTISQVEALLDATNRNVTFRSTSEARRLAKQRLAPIYQRKMAAITADDWLVVALVQAIRNAIAHGSVQSLRDMNFAITAMRNCNNSFDASLGDRATSVRASGIGAYLYAHLPHALGGPAVRLAYLCARVRDIGIKLT